MNRMEKQLQNRLVVRFLLIPGDWLHLGIRHIAAKLARKAASVTHGGDGIHGGIFVAVCISYRICGIRYEQRYWKKDLVIFRKTAIMRRLYRVVMELS